VSANDESRREPGDALGAGQDGEPGQRRRDEPPGEPGGEVYDWYVRALELLEAGSPEAAASLLTHAHAREPGSASVLEALARASFDGGRYDEAAQHFEKLTAVSPDNDYAYFGLGLSRMRQGDFAGAIEQLALAAAMRPQRRDYDQALREARATLRFREQRP
jgi:tetratricopeptide (TPR) repeat protein